MVLNAIKPEKKALIITILIYSFKFDAYNKISILMNISLTILTATITNCNLDFNYFNCFI